MPMDSMHDRFIQLAKANKELGLATVESLCAEREAKEQYQKAALAVAELIKVLPVDLNCVYEKRDDWKNLARVILVQNFTTQPAYREVLRLEAEQVAFETQGEYGDG